MMIARGSMQLIVDEIHDAVQHDIDIMDEYGTVTASTDKAQLGTFRRGAYTLVQSNMPELIIDEASVQNEKPGVYLPIYIEDNIVGVVGVLGRPDDVKNYAHLIQKLSKVLFEVAWEKDQSSIQENLSRSFLYSWLFDTSVNRDPHFQLRAKTAGINAGQTRFIAVLAIDYPELDASGKQVRCDGVEARIKRLLRERSDQHALLLISGQLVLFLDCTELSKARETVLHCMRVLFMAEPGISISAGIGSAANWYTEVQKSFREAMLAAKIASKMGAEKLCVYEDLYLEKLLTNIPLQAKHSFVDRLFSHCTVQDRKQFLETLHAFFQYNGSITKAAASQFIHKNTMQYRLSRLKTFTGLDPRILKDAGVLYTAMLIEEEISNFRTDNEEP